MSILARPEHAATLSASDLAEVVRAFGSASERLSDSHEALELETRRLREELAEARGQLARARELAALGELAAGIAHEIRNPLGAILLHVELLRAGLAAPAASPDPGLAACDAVRRAAGRIETIVADVLRFARDGRLERRPVAVREIVDEALADLAATLDHASVTVKVVERDRRETLAELDRGLCAQAVANLVRNAVEAMASTPAAERIVRIELGRDRRADARGRRVEHVTVAVEDRGPGVPDSEFVRIFRPFASGNGCGTGLGLAIVHRVVDAHGGRVTVRNLEVGARFELSLPTVADPSPDDGGPDDPLSLATWRRLGRDGPPRRAG